MKILQLLCFPLYGSGSGTYVRKLSETLIKNGHEVAIAVPDTRELKGVKIYPIKLPFMVAFTGHPEYPEAKLYSQLSGAELNDVQTAFSDAVIKAVEDYKPDVIHVHHASNLSWVANYVKSVYQIHYIVTSHNTDVINAVLDKRYIPLTQDALNRADIITAVSANTRERLLKIIGKGYTNLTRKTKISPCGVDTKAFSVLGNTKNAIAKFHLQGKKVVLYSGKITVIKGVDLVIKAAKSFPEVAFVIMGDGEERKKMEELIQKTKVNNVILTGYLGSNDKKLIGELYRAATVVVAPSTVSEGLPLSVLEAMSSGTPVVASNIGGIPTAVKHMKNGLLIKPRSTSALVEALKIILNDKKLALKLAKKARRDAVDKFDWNKIATQLERYYQICISRSKKNRATKRPSYVTEEEYQTDKELIKHVHDQNSLGIL